VIKQIITYKRGGKRRHRGASAGPSRPSTLLFLPISPFGKQYPGAALEYVEVMRGMDEMGADRYYLRYRTSTAPAPVEFWGDLAKGKKAKVNLKTGQVKVPAGP
jgi:hypothetical protein